MIRLALIGKNISHSKSPEIYEKHLLLLHTYDLLDYSSSEQIPSLKELFETYDGINITSPYKKHFYNKVTKLHETSFVNVIKKVGSEFIGANSDQMALEKIIPEKVTKNKIHFVVLLGNGPMAQISCKILDILKIDYLQMSRSLGNLDQFKNYDYRPDQNYLIINGCSRDFSYNRQLPLNVSWFDYNYNNPSMFTLSELLGDRFQDGSELLKMQAEEAIRFWAF
jgi:shikimate dehydrogenase